MEALAINKSVVRGIAVPNYSNATKEQSAMIFIANRYTRIYFSIIEKARSRVLSNTEYKETHHIIPRSMGGGNSSDNLVELTAREHFICHKLLVRITEGESRGKMAFALVLMSGKRGSKIYDSTKKLLAERVSQLHTGKSPITNGIVDKTLFKDEVMPEGFYYGFSPATLKKHGDGNKGKKWITNGIISYQPKDDTLPGGFCYGQADYHIKKNSEALSGPGNPMYGKFGPDHPAYGNKLTDETKKLMSKSKAGAKNPNFGKVTANAIQIEIDGVIYRSATEARQKTGLSRREIEKLYKRNIK
jgi:hypothetical protein